MRKRPLHVPVLDYKIYPRKVIRPPHVRNIKDAIEAGEALPPIVVEKKTNRIVDGFHRYEAYVSLFEMDHKIPVIERTYRDDKELFLDTIRLNSTHGLALDRVAKAKCAQKCIQMGLDEEKIADALKMSVDRLKTLLDKRTAFTSNGRTPVMLKGSVPHLRGKKLTKRQEKAIDQVGGYRVGYYISQIMSFISGDLIDKENEKVMGQLEELRMMLNEFLGGE